MWVWKKTIAKANEEEWQARLSNLPGTVISEAAVGVRMQVIVRICFQLSGAYLEAELTPRLTS